MRERFNRNPVETPKKVELRADQKAVDENAIVFSRRVAVGGLVALGVGVLGLKKYEGDRVTNIFHEKGDILPEQENILREAGYEIYFPGEETISSFRATGVDIDPYPLDFEEDDPEQIRSSLTFAAVKPGEFFRPGQEPVEGEEASIRDINGLLRNGASDAQKLDGSFTLKSVGVIDIIGFDQWLVRNNKPGLFDGDVEGFAITADESDGTGVAINKVNGAYVYTTFDNAYRDATPPTEKILAAGFVVER